MNTLTGFVGGSGRYNCSQGKYFSGSVDGGDVESGAVVDMTVTDGKRMDDSGDEGSREWDGSSPFTRGERDIWKPLSGSSSLSRKG